MTVIEMANVPPTMKANTLVAHPKPMIGTSRWKTMGYMIPPNGMLDFSRLKLTSKIES